MNAFEKILFTLQATMERPEPFGWFHLLCLALMLAVIVFLYFRIDSHSEKQLKTILGVYGFVVLVLELMKQIVWSFNYDPIANIVTWDYQWYSAPFQLCTTPMYVSLIAFFMRDCKLRKALLSYLAFTTILGSIATIFLPDSCFVETILVNVHTMWLHYGSFVVSVYLLMSGVVKTTWKNLKSAIGIFIVFVGIATLLNVGVYNSGVLAGETFNMFYISPYFISSLPVFNVIQQNVPYIIFLLIYIVSLSLGSVIVWSMSKGIGLLFGNKMIGANTLLKRL